MTYPMARGYCQRQGIEMLYLNYIDVSEDMEHKIRRRKKMKTELKINAISSLHLKVERKYYENKKIYIFCEINDHPEIFLVWITINKKLRILCSLIKSRCVDFKKRGGRNCYGRIDVPAGELGGGWGCSPLQIPFFRQKSLSSHNLGSKRKSSALLDLTYCQLILFCLHPFRCHFSIV